MKLKLCRGNSGRSRLPHISRPPLADTQKYAKRIFYLRLESSDASAEYFKALSNYTSLYIKYTRFLCHKCHNIQLFNITIKLDEIVEKNSIVHTCVKA